MKIYFIYFAYTENPTINLSLVHTIDQSSVEQRGPLTEKPIFY